MVIFAYINYRGAKETGKAGNVVTVLKVLILLVFVSFGAQIIASHPVRLEQLFPFFPRGFLGILTAMGLTYIAFEGYEIIAQSGEEIKNPKKNIPRAIFLSLIIVVPIYIVVAFVALGAVNPGGMHAWDFLAAKKEIAMVEAARSIATWGGVILLIGGLFSTISALNATIYSSSRVSFAMGRDFNFPEVFSRIHKRFKTPSGSIAVSSSLIIIMLLLLPIEDIASSADIMFLFLFIFVNVALIHIRKKTPGRLTGYKSPLFPLFPVMGILTQSVLVIVMFAYSPRSFFISLLWIGMGLSIYYGYSRLREKGEAGPEIVLAEKELAHKDLNIVLGVEEKREVLPLMNIALPIAKEKDGEIFVSHIIPLPPQTPLNVGKKFLEERKEFLKTADKLGEKNHIPVSYNIRASHKIYHGLLDTVVENKGNILIVGTGELGIRRKILGSILDPLIQEVPCDVGIMKIGGSNKFKKILVSTAGGPNSKIAFEWASYIVKRNRGTLTLLSVVRDEAEREKADHRLQETKKGARYEKKKVEDKIIVGNNIAATILEESKGYDLFLFGATRERFWRRIQFGTIPKKLIRSSSVTTLIVRRYEGVVLSWLRRFIAG